MSDEEEVTSTAVVETRLLWSVEFREAEDYPWKEIGTARADSDAQLRTYDYGCKNHEGMEHRILRTDVTIQVVDPEVLRAQLKEEKEQAAKRSAAAVQSA